MVNKRQVLALLLLTAAVVAGGFIRLYDLDQQPFRADELLHHFAAVELRLEGVPALPSGELYRRGIDYTRLVAVAQERIADSALAARLPSAVLGIVGLVLMATVAWAMAGPWAAAVVTLLLAFYPHAVFLSRMARFYTMQMAIGLPALLTGWWAFEAMSRPERFSRPHVRAWFWSLITLVVLLAAARVQVVTLTILAGWATCILGVAIRDIRNASWMSWKGSPAVQLVILGLICATGFLFFQPETVNRLLFTATSAPFWARNVGELVHDSNQYLEWLYREIPVVMALAPLAFLTLFRRDALLGLYLIGWFAVPLLIHSFLPFKQERFIFLAMPALFLAIGIAVVHGGALLYREIHRATSAVRPRRHAGLVASAVLAVVGMGFAIPAILPGVALAGDEIIHEPSVEPGWTQAAEIIKEDPDAQRLPLGSFRPLHALFYVGRVDFTTHVGRLEIKVADTYVRRPEGVSDVYSGVPVLTTPASIRDYFPHASEVLIMIEADRLPTARTDPALARALREKAMELCEGHCGTLRLYRLQLGQ